ncbi:hypothetical protein RJ640_028683 [Escallonia rubra]|uniref:Non-haem dioxygenase N-terminal domain-containing protein n=1 Tax=Escallonia rubra TaxID=112253 RepID=A0AA88R4T3_9ASTE|nr:hypothetical protein RJ640_028683 [Escallonia rubra]
MGEAQIPYLSFTGEALDLKQERTEAWKALSNKVREACETHGCFLLSYDGIPADLCQRMFVAARPLFDLPEETKNSYTNPDVIKSHITRSPANPLLESFGIGDAHWLKEAQAFTHLMWPNGNLSFW